MLTNLPKAVHSAVITYAYDILSLEITHIGTSKRVVDHNRWCTVLDDMYWNAVGPAQRENLWFPAPCRRALDCVARAKVTCARADEG